MATDPALRHGKQTVEVHGRRMAYVEAGSASRPVFVLLHGNPTSSYLWRNVVPHLERLGRCVAPDLIGMGDSDKLPGEGDERYRFVEQRSFLDGFLEAVGVQSDVVLVVHDWGSALGFDWARRHAEAVLGIAYLEAICGVPAFEAWPDTAKDLFAGLRSDGGEAMCLERNLFVERVLPASVLRELTAEEMDHYRAPFREAGEARRPTLTWPREIPFDGQPADVAAIVADYADWLAHTAVPKLYLHVEPGFLSPVFAERCRQWPNQREVSINGHHFAQEDAPDEIGRAVAAWYRDAVGP